MDSTEYTTTIAVVANAYNNVVYQHTGSFKKTNWILSNSAATCCVIKCHSYQHEKLLSL